MYILCIVLLSLSTIETRQGNLETVHFYSEVIYTNSI